LKFDENKLDLELSKYKNAEIENFYVVIKKTGVSIKDDFLLTSYWKSNVFR